MTPDPSKVEIISPKVPQGKPSFRSRLVEAVLGPKVGGARVIPVATKIIAIFILFLLLSNLVSNFINSQLNQTEIKKMVREILIKDLADLNGFCNSQAEVYKFKNDLAAVTATLENRGLADLKNRRSLVMGVKEDSTLLFLATKGRKAPYFTDAKALNLMMLNRQRGQGQDSLNFAFDGMTYYGYFKWNPAWEMYVIKAEEESEYTGASRRIFRTTMLLVGAITLVAAVLGVLLLQMILKYIGRITRAMMEMNAKQHLDIIPLEGAPNDDITYLGVSFNSLAATIDTLLKIFRKFVAQDITDKAYRERRIRLEGNRRDLTILFTDIKNFTTMTESLQTDIIKLLNIHYSKTIRDIVEHHGIIGSIIGDALLAVFGVMREQGVEGYNKSFAAVHSAYRIQGLAKDTRALMEKKRLAFLEAGLPPDDEHERIYKAVSIEVGVGIDGGTVFYGTIGSYDQMTNTVIGDNVNSASRLEGLTREYKVPVICSRYVKEDIEAHVPGNPVTFMELDTVQVKGKTVGKQVFWPILTADLTPELEEQIQWYRQGLDLFYKGEWRKAVAFFERCTLPPAGVFRERVVKPVPENWSGIWTMTSK